MRKKFKGLKVSLHEGYPAHLETWLRRDETNIAFTLIEETVEA